MKIGQGLIIASIIFVSSSLSSCINQEWESLFNGMDLEGWNVKCISVDEGKEYWTVREGYIECNSLGDKEHNYIWLATDKEFTDFHLKLKFQVFRESGGNSEVQFRSSYDHSEGARFTAWLNGPQVDIHCPTPFRTGLIYDETEDVNRWIHPSLPDAGIVPEQAPESALETSLVFFEDGLEAWNSMEIICEGMSVRTFVNGNHVAEFDGEGILNDEVHKYRKSGETGFIALQLHMYDELKIRYKDIFIKELTR